LQGFVVRHFPEWMQGGVLSTILLASLPITGFKNLLIEKGEW
jgi:hypothetical protein